jgi:2'-5' RNA ligase
MRCEPPESAEPINQYAVVSYIPGKLGDFITDLRQELVNGCTARSHVTILPPRPLVAAAELAEADLRIRSSAFPAFEMDIPRIRVFKETSVIFAEVVRGRECFSEMHNALNTGVLGYVEPFDYHPHVTLAQGLDPAIVAECYELARRRWEESAPRTSVWIENLTFVQNTSANLWIVLAEFDLRGALVS